MIKLSTQRVTIEGIPLVGSEPPETLGVADDPFIRTPYPMDYKLKAAMTGEGLLVTGVVSTTIACVCGFCLKPYELHIENRDVCHYYENPLKPEIDLTPDVREDILLNFPQSLICGDDCEGSGIDSDAPNVAANNGRWGELDKLGLE